MVSLYLGNTLQSDRGPARLRAHLQFRDSLFDLLDLNLAEAFNLEKRLSGGSVDRLHSVKQLSLGRERDRICLQQQCSSHYS